MTRRLAATVTALVLAALLAGCSNDSADPGTISASASSGAPSTPSVAAVSPNSPTSSVPPTSETVTAASSDGSSAQPWPSTLSADEITAAQGAIAAYRSYWQTVDLAAAQPGQDWTEEIAFYATGIEQQSLLDTLRKLVARLSHGR